jgi:hypothetical protein
MSEIHEREKARYRFRQLLQELFAWQPTCTAPYEGDCDATPFVEVDRADALNCFLRKYPAYERFREELAEVRRSEQKFFLNPELWRKGCED